MDQLKSIQKYIEEKKDEILRFTSEMVKIQSLTGDEEAMARLVKREMESLQYDDVSIDKLGNVIGRIGKGNPGILFDSHMDTVTVTDGEQWAFNPFGGEIIDGYVCGRGSVDMKAGLAASVYAGAAVKSLGLTVDKAICITASVMEEDYDGEALFELLSRNDLRPDNVIVCEPSSLKLALGHRGRALITVETDGVSAHGSAPEQGENAVYKMQKIIGRVEVLSEKFIRSSDHSGSITLSIIDSTAVSANAVPSGCRIFLDRRLALNENKAYIENEMAELLEGTDARWFVYQVEGKSWTGEDVILDSFLPAWELDSGEILARLGNKAYEAVFGVKPERFFWNFCTNGVASSGRLGIPTIGFGPGNPKLAHKRDEKCSVEEVLKATEFFAILCISEL